MPDAHILHIEEQATVDRGNGIVSIPLTGTKTDAQSFSTGITVFPPGGSLEMHSHNTEESITMLEGEAECEVNGERHRVKAFDTTYIPAGIPHRFVNVGNGPLKILWIYGSTNVTRTFADGKVQGQFGRSD